MLKLAFNELETINGGRCDREDRVCYRRCTRRGRRTFRRCENRCRARR